MRAPRQPQWSRPQRTPSKSAHRPAAASGHPGESLLAQTSAAPRLSPGLHKPSPQMPQDSPAAGERRDHRGEALSRSLAGPRVEPRREWGDPIRGRPIPRRSPSAPRITPRLGSHASATKAQTAKMACRFHRPRVGCRLQIGHAGGKGALRDVVALGLQIPGPRRRRTTGSGAGGRRFWPPPADLLRGRRLRALPELGRQPAARFKPAPASLPPRPGAACARTPAPPFLPAPGRPVISPASPLRRPLRRRTAASSTTVSASRRCSSLLCAR